MKVFLDDQKPAPKGWVRVDNVADCLELLNANGGGLVTELSLDHDLGEGEREGYEVLAVIERAVVFFPRDAYTPPTIYIHTENPPARDRMLAAVEAIIRHRQQPLDPRIVKAVDEEFWDLVDNTPCD